MMNDYTNKSTPELERSLDLIDDCVKSHWPEDVQAVAAMEDKRLIEIELKRRFPDGTK